jgi:hypothetical protein
VSKFKVVFPHLLVGTEKNHNQDSLASYGDLNQGPPEYKTGVLPIDDDVRFSSVAFVSEYIPKPDVKETEGSSNHS